MSLLNAVVQSNVHKIVRSSGAILLVFSLVVPTLALPNGAFLSGIATFGGSGTMSWHLSGELLGSLLPTVLGALTKTDLSAKKKASKGVQFDKIEIKPGDQTVLQGDTLNLVAIAYNGDQPVAGMDFVWTVSEAEGDDRSEREFRNGRLRAAKPGRFVVNASAQGQYASVRIDVRPNHGIAIAKLLTKSENDRTVSDRQQIERWRADGSLWSRSGGTSKSIYSIADERALYEADQLKRQRAMQHSMDPPKGPPSTVSAKPAPADMTLAQRDLFPVAEQTMRRTHGPSAEVVENSEERYQESESTLGAPLFWLAEPLGWDGGNWSLADDRDNWTGRPAGATEDVGAGNGNYTFSAPAVSLPGRGIDINLGLHYNSRLWANTSGTMTYNADAGYPAPGWNLGFGRMYYFGSTGGCMLITPDGTRQSYQPMSNQVYNSGGVYQHHYGARTIDSSYIDYTCSYNSSGSGVSLYGSAKLPDGTVISYGARSSDADQLFPVRIIDAHGNYINIAYENNQGPEIDTITDTLGRTISFEYSGGLLTHITGPGYNGTTRTFVKFAYGTHDLEHNFGSMPVSAPSTDPTVMTAIFYPTSNTGYWFGDTGSSYSPYGMIAQIIEKRGMSDLSGISGGTMTKQSFYDYPTDTTATLSDAPTYSSRTETWDTMEGGTANAVTSYSVSEPADEVIIVTRPDGTKSKQTSKINNGNDDDGLWYQTEILNPSDAVLQKTKIFLQQGTLSTEYKSFRTTKIELTDDKNQTTTTEFSHASNSYNQVTSQKEYGYGTTLFREKRFTYETNGYYANRHIFSLVKKVEDYDGSNNRLTLTEYAYDGGTLVEAPNVVQHDDTYDPHTTGTMQGTTCLAFNHQECTYEWESWWDGEYWVLCQCEEYEQISIFDWTTAYRGNLTSVTTYENGGSTPSGAITYNYTYDITGNQRTATTNCCQQIESTFSTATQFSQPDSITKGSSDSGSSHRMTQSFTYDTNTKVTTSHTDYNSDTTTISYDAVSRPTIVTLSSGGKKTTTYGDSTLSKTELVEKASTDNGGGTVSNSSTYFNGRGQTIKSTYQAGASNHNATSIQYDVMGRQWKVSMPYDTGSSPSNWTVFAYDYLSRPTTQTAPDGSVTSRFYNEPTRPDSATTWTNGKGTTVRTRDAWGRERWTWTDAYGRLLEVVEPDPDGDGGVEDADNEVTAYAYDHLDRLTSLTQGDQTRSFKYDSLGRLTRQKLAEQTATINDSGNYVPEVSGVRAGAVWSEAFKYDARSNLKERTDARGVIATLSYEISSALDPLNRLQEITYSTSSADTTYTINPASAVSFEYMTSGDKTRVKKVITNGIVTEENTFDGEGRIESYEMKFDTRTSYPFKTEYEYDSVDSLKEVKYPLKHPSTTDRTIVAPSYDVASRISGMSVDGSTQLGNITYNTASQVTELKTGAGTSHPRIEQYSYDSQTGLLTGQVVKKTTGHTFYMDMTYSYTREGDSAGTNTGTEITGQLTKIVDNRDNNRDRVYEFDGLGRLKEAKGGLAAGATGVTADWTQEYSYDRYGNKTGVTATGGVPADGLASVSVDTVTNRMTSASGWIYDLTGNVVRGQNASGVWQRFEYDAAGRLVKIRDDSSNIIETYTYGATRERLMTETSAGRTYYVWGGQSVIGEYTETGSGTIPTFTKSYVYAGSRLLAVSYSSGLLEFHHPDRIGTQLVTFGGTIGTVRQSTYPFGTLEQGPRSNQVFTSYDRSTSTGLDYAINRTYSSGQSRFTQVDPIGMAAASIGDPQSNNLYAYVQNMPTDLIDPSGLNASPGGGYAYYLDGFLVSPYLALMALASGAGYISGGFAGGLGNWVDFDDWRNMDPDGFPGTGTIFLLDRGELQRRLDEIQLSQGLDRMQTALDVIGFFPVVGDALDVVNACISVGRGNLGEAALSGIATIPAAGSVIKGAVKGSKAFKLNRVLPGLKNTGVMGGVLPSVADLRKLPAGELLDFQADLIKSVQKRIDNFKKYGPTATISSNKGHGSRLSQEQMLIKSINKICNK